MLGQSDFCGSAVLRVGGVRGGVWGSGGSKSALRETLIKPRASRPRQRTSSSWPTSRTSSTLRTCRCILYIADSSPCLLRTSPPREKERKKEVLGHGKIMCRHDCFMLHAGDMKTLHCGRPLTLVWLISEMCSRVWYPFGSSTNAP